MNSSKPVLILGKGITGESFREYFSKKKQTIMTFDTRVKKESLNLIKKEFFNKNDMNKLNFDKAETKADHSKKSFVYNFF